MDNLPVQNKARRKNTLNPRQQDTNAPQNHPARLEPSHDQERQKADRAPREKQPPEGFTA